MPKHRARAFRLIIFLLATRVAFASWPVGTPSQNAASQIDLEVDPAQSKINWTLSATFHTVHGTFACTRGSVRFDPTSGKASGEIIADARSGESGDSGRDKSMHAKVLESAKFPAVTFVPDRVDGKVLTQGASKVQIHGMFEIHGAEHELTVPAEVNFSGDRWTAKAAFDVPYVKWGMKDPSGVFLHVGSAVNVELELSGHAIFPHGN
jgi:polyisoprenoid-binding protein YceI